MIDDILNALGGGIPNLGTELANLLATAATDVAGLLPGELGVMIGEAIAAF